LCLIPFFLGASRGSIIALFIPFIFYFLFQKGLKRKIVAITAIATIAIGFIIAAQYLGLGVFNRFINIGIGQAGSSMTRLDMWQSSWYQFLENPIFGNSLEATNVGVYPHNILLETLITTGFFGFSAYLLFLYFTFKKAIKIIKYNSSHFFIVVIFLQALSKNMVTGGLYSTSWLAIGSGLILGYNYSNVGLKDRFLTNNF
jgi:O-antigen ligase